MGAEMIVPHKWISSKQCVSSQVSLKQKRNTLQLVTTTQVLYIFNRAMSLCLSLPNVSLEELRKDITEVAWRMKPSEAWRYFLPYVQRPCKSAASVKCCPLCFSYSIPIIQVHVRRLRSWLDPFPPWNARHHYKFVCVCVCVSLLAWCSIDFWALTSDAEWDGPAPQSQASDKIEPRSQFRKSHYCLPLLKCLYLLPSCRKGGKLK